MWPKIKLSFVPNDLWIGAYWRLSKSLESSYRRLDVYLCLLPLFPLRLRWEWGWKNPIPSVEAVEKHGVPVPKGLYYDKTTRTIKRGDVDTGITLEEADQI